jgi:hypothetical protein
VIGGVVLLNLHEVRIPDILTVLRLAHGIVSTVEGGSPVGKRGCGNNGKQ